ncbi:c-type cytochrome [Solimonas marina]|uniref:Cytochrome c n=1 Tax=Solimonas marina TaxID=2714601 RepID=A0A969WD37_9GAMM|nr:cytochrome c [Solimonas marina]NKF23875.1 cytochrome c [Solimonas marina]
MNKMKMQGVVAAVLLSTSAVAMAAEPDAAEGKKVYTTICQGCHMPDAKGAVGAGRYPALANNPKLAAKQYPMMMIVNGSRAMPSFARMLAPDEIAAAVNYVRTHFGNHYPDVLTTAEVKAVLPQKSDYERH